MRPLRTYEDMSILTYVPNEDSNLSLHPQSDHSLLSAWKKLHPWLSKMHPGQILVRLCRCWSESSLGAHVRRYIFRCYDSNNENDPCYVKMSLWSVYSKVKGQSATAFDTALFSIKIVSIFFLFLDKNICCGYSLEAPHRGASNEYPQHMFSLRNKKTIYPIPILIWTYGLCSFAHQNFVCIQNFETEEFIDRHQILIG